MATLLHLDSSPLASSVSRELTREFVSNWKIAHPTGQVIVSRSGRQSPKASRSSLDLCSLYAGRSAAARAESPLAYSEECIAELEQADEYVFGVAMHNFSIPSVLKLWIDQVVRGGRTFAYGAERTQGPAHRAKRPPFLSRPGESTKQELPWPRLNFIDPYLRHDPRIHRHHRRDICHRRRHGAAHVREGRSRPVPATPSGAG